MSTGKDLSDDEQWLTTQEWVDLVMTAAAFGWRPFEVASQPQCCGRCEHTCRVDLPTALKRARDVFLETESIVIGLPEEPEDYAECPEGGLSPREDVLIYLHSCGRDAGAEMIDRFIAHLNRQPDQTSLM